MSVTEQQTVKKFLNNPEEIVPESLAGLAAAHPDLVRVDFENQVVIRKDAPVKGKVALVSGPTGLEVIQRIGATAASWLRPGGVVICEIGEKQGVSATSSFMDLPAIVRQDLTGRDRYIVAVKP